MDNFATAAARPARSSFAVGLERADRYGVAPPVLASWVHHLVYVRNLCAHHARLWDRVWSVQPQLPADPAWRKPHLANNQRLAATLLILYSFVKRCLDSPAPDPFPPLWRGRVDILLAALPSAPNAAGKLGLTPEWPAGPLWQ